MTYQCGNVMACSAIACAVVTHNAMNASAHDSDSDKAQDVYTVVR